MKEMGETQVWCLVQEDPLEEELALHPLQYSCLEIPMDRGAWWAIVHGVAKNRTWLSNWALKIVTPNKAKLLSRSTLQDLWPKWFSSPLEHNQSYAAPTLPRPLLGIFYCTLSSSKANVHLLREVSQPSSLIACVSSPSSAHTCFCL